MTQHVLGIRGLLWRRLGSRYAEGRGKARSWVAWGSWVTSDPKLSCEVSGEPFCLFLPRTPKTPRASLGLRQAVRRLGSLVPRQWSRSSKRFSSRNRESYNAVARVTLRDKGRSSAIGNRSHELTTVQACNTPLQAGHS
jgi:hypothetical protein